MADTLTQSKPTKSTIHMEGQRRQSNLSGYKFSFPIIPMHGGGGHLDGSPSDPEFEFGNTNTTTTAAPSPNYPADELFSNGKLLPHSFPVFDAPVGGGCESPIAGIYARSSSRTSSVSSKDSMTPSRSNSTNSSRSSSTTSVSGSVSARSSVSSTDATESRRNMRKDHHQKMMIKRNELDQLHNHLYMNNYNVNNYNKPSQSQRWQFIAPMPALGRQGSVRRKEEVAAPTPATTTETATEKKKVGTGRRIFRSIVSACKECHALP